MGPSGSGYSGSVDGGLPSFWPGAGSTGHGRVDLSLLDETALRLTVTPNPWLEHARFAAGSPVEISDMAAAFAEAGGHLDDAHRYSTRSQQLIGQGFTNNGNQVYDQRAHMDALPKNFPDAGSRLADTARRLHVVGDELVTRTQGAAKKIDDVHGQLVELQNRWRDEVAAVLGPDGVTTKAVMDSLVARRDALDQQQKDMVSAAGNVVRTSVGEYEGHLSAMMIKLANVGFLPPEEFDAGPGDIDFTPAAGRDAARQTAAAVATADPGTLTRVDGSTNGVSLITEKILAGGTATPQETAYLQSYYDELARSGTLPRLEGAVTAAAPLAYQSSQGGDAAVAHTLGTVSNGLMALSRVDDGAHVPASVTALINQPLGAAAQDPNFPNNGTRPRPWTPGEALKPSEIAGLTTYAGTAGLISRSTITGGTTFTEELGESALRAKQQLNVTSPYADRVSPGTGDPDADAGFISQIQKEHLETAEQGEKPINQLLETVARNPTASQALLGVVPAADRPWLPADDLLGGKPFGPSVVQHDPNRSTLLGAGWVDGSGAAAVLRSATAPEQATPQLAEGSAALTKTLFTEIGDDPYAWSKLAPAGSDIRHQLAELTASRIDTFGTPSTAESAITPAQRNADGTFTAGVQLHGTTISSDDERADYLRFFGSGTAQGQSDPDMVRIRAAADNDVLTGVTGALHRGDSSFIESINRADEYDRVIEGSQYSALRDGHVSSADATTQLQQDSVTAARVTERTFVNTAVHGLAEYLPKPFDAISKDAFNLLFDSEINKVDLTGTLSRPETDAAQYLADTNSHAQAHRAYLLTSALQHAGALDGLRTERLLNPDGSLRPLEQIEADPAATEALKALPTDALDRNTDWKAAVNHEMRGRYEPGSYVPFTSTAPLSSEDLDRIKNGPS